LWRAKFLVEQFFIGSQNLEWLATIFAFSVYPATFSAKNLAERSRNK